MMHDARCMSRECPFGRYNDETHEDEITNVVNIYELMKLGVFVVSFAE